MRNLVNSGHTIDVSMDKALAKKVNFDGREYRNLKHLCESIGVDLKKVKVLLNAGYTIEGAVQLVLDGNTNSIDSTHLRIEKDVLADDSVESELVTLLTSLQVDSNLVRVNLNEGLSLVDAILKARVRL